MRSRKLPGEVEDDAIAYWQVGLKIGFDVEEKKGKEAQAAGSKNESAREAKVAGKYRCKVCGYIYDPKKGDSDNGIPPGTSFEDLPDDWECPECGVNKDQFEEMRED